MFWRLGFIVVLVAGMAGLAVAQETRPAIRSDPLSNAQAADLMSDLLTYYGDLANRRVDAMRAFIREIDKSTDFDVHKPAVPPRQEMAFADAFKGVLLFVNEGGGRVADPALGKMTPEQLAREFEALQHYNLQLFLYLNTRRDEIARMKVYLSSIEQFDAYLEWAKIHAPRTQSILTTAPTTQGARAMADWLGEQAETAKARAWDRARAEGMTREQFEREWDQRQQAMKQDLSQRIDAVKKLGNYFAPRSAQPQRAQPGTPGDSWAAQGAAAPLPTPANAALPAGVPAGSLAFTGNPMSSNDPRWQQGYYGPNNFNGWNDDFSDVFQPSGAGGTYRRYDPSVNADYDTRVQGEIDRRVNTSMDRRQNIRVDPRVNY